MWGPVPDSPKLAKNPDYLRRARTHRVLLTLRFLAAFGEAGAIRHHGPGFSGGHARTSGAESPKAAKNPHCVRRTRTHRVGTEIRETENFASLPWRVRKPRGYCWEIN